MLELGYGGIGRCHGADVELVSCVQGLGEVPYLICPNGILLPESILFLYNSLQKFLHVGQALFDLSCFA